MLFLLKFPSRNSLHLYNSINNVYLWSNTSPFRAAQWNISLLPFYISVFDSLQPCRQYFGLFNCILMILGYLTSRPVPLCILILHSAVSVTHPRLAPARNASRADFPPSTGSVKVLTTSPKVWVHFSESSPSSTANHEYVTLLLFRHLYTHFEMIEP